MSLVRVSLVAIMVFVLGGFLAGILFLVALFSQRHAFAIAAEIALIGSLLGNSVIWGLRTYVLFNSGSWTTLIGNPASREEQPAKFAAWLALYGLATAAPGIAAGFLTWTMLAPKS